MLPQIQSIYQSKNFQFVSLLIVILLQIAFALNMIFNSENTLNNGRLYKFKCAPVDPFDPFRGKFVSLRFEAETFRSFDESLTLHKEYFASVRTNTKGNAEIYNLNEVQPEDGDYFKVKIIRKSGRNVILEFPFNRYYIEESKAKAAELVYRERPELATAFVYIANGRTVLDKIMLENQTIEEAAIEYLDRTNEK
jgi:uncharacterized membrane-anchored protein